MVYEGFRLDLPAEFAGIVSLARALPCLPSSLTFRWGCARQTMDRIDQQTGSRADGAVRTWSQIGRGVLDVARIATAVHLTSAARRIGQRDGAKESPRSPQGG
jgi:hypothetical protein